jgi:PAS domain S-box-containing protein
VSPQLTDAEFASHRAIVNAIPDMIIRIGRDGVFRSFEGNVRDLWWPADVYIGKKVEEVLPAATASRFAEALENAFAGSDVQHLEYTIPFEGAVQHYESRIVKSTEVEAIAIVRNITHERETESQLQEYQWHLEHQVAVRSADLSVAESKYKDIFHHSGAPSIMVDHDFTISMANSKFEEFTGYPRDEVENKMKWTDFIHTADRDMVTRYHFARCSGTEPAPDEYECRIVVRDQSVKTIIIKVGMLSEPGRSVASIIDITSLKQTEQELRDREALYSAILEGYEGLIYFIDRDYRIRFMNENLIRAIGGDATGQNCFDYQKESKTDRQRPET